MFVTRDSARRKVGIEVPFNGAGRGGIFGRFLGRKRSGSGRGGSTKVSLKLSGSTASPAIVSLHESEHFSGDSEDIPAIFLHTLDEIEPDADGFDATGMKSVRHRTAFIAILNAAFNQFTGDMKFSRHAQDIQVRTSWCVLGRGQAECPKCGGWAS